MKRFATRNTSPAKKGKTVPRNASEIKVIKMNPCTLGAWVVKKWNGNIAGYIKDLIDAFYENGEPARDLKITAVVNRKMFGTADTEMMSKGYNWKMILRTLEDEELDDVDKVAVEWGEKIAETMNVHFAPKFKYLEIFEFGCIINKGSDLVNSINNYVIRRDVILFCKMAFTEAIEDMSFFQDKELMVELFPNKKNVMVLFYPDM